MQNGKKTYVEESDNEPHRDDSTRSSLEEAYPVRVTTLVNKQF